jgi:gluconokinase
MGVCGCGKSTVGRLLAERLDWSFHDGDDFHPASNVAKMRAGTPLNDTDRHPWLLAIRQFMDESERAGRSAVIACSALRQVYRDVLGSNLPWVRFVHLHGTKALLAERLQARPGHFMPPALLDSQLATLEAPTDAITVDIALEPQALVTEIIRQLGFSERSKPRRQ